MGKKLFFLSLIVLSVVMGMHWLKNRPKIRPKQARERVALNLQDLQVQDKEPGETKNPDDNPPKQGNPDQGDENSDTGKPEGADSQNNPDNPDESNTPAEVKPGDVIADGDDPLMADPLIIALRSMRRNPFEHSPYAQLVQELQKKEEIASKPGEKKSVKLLTANFSATIQTRKELVAVIDSRLYRKGEFFQDKKISEIKSEIIALESGTGTYLIPKRGVNVSIAEDGTYTFVDNFRKN
ncbi:MAG: hypothetical protein KKB51_24345 [Candidatus Riflebacteria bacterium]|nr:hypothetical protein [Candidatus Riflebacteria bacterium]